MKERLAYIITGLVIGSLLAGWVALEWADRKQGKLQSDVLVTAGWVRAKVVAHPERAAPDIDTTPLDAAGIEPAVAGTIHTEWIEIPAPFNNSR